MLGTGILKGMVETAKNFAESYTDPANRLTTVEYPEQRIASKENARQFPMLIHDTEDPMKGLRCVACQICEKECPPQCIYIVKSKDKRADYKGQMQFYPATFDIDLSVCMSCQICVEVCPFESIKMDTEFELSNTDRFGGLLVNKHQLAKSNEHYRKIHPTEAAASDAALAVEVAKAQAKAKADAEAKAKAAAEAKAKAEAAAAAAPVGAVTSTPAAKPSSPAAAPAAAPAA